MSKPARRARRKLSAGVTIKDVGRLAGVSPMTVSRVVNGNAYVSNTTRHAVQRAVRELGYSPNLAARNLASERGERLGLLYGNPSSAYLSEFLVGALEAATRHGVQLVLEKCEPTPVVSRRAVRRLLAGAVVAEAHRRGLDVPRDLTVVGFDDTLIASTIWPELTTIQQPIARMAAEAVDMLVTAVRGSRRGAERLHRLIPHALIARQSAAAPKLAALPRA
jgi:DNA-binding LacI/PurR family transcriptional regulator